VQTLDTSRWGSVALLRDYGEAQLQNSKFVARNIGKQKFQDKEELLTSSFPGEQYLSSGNIKPLLYRLPNLPVGLLTNILGS